MPERFLQLTSQRLDASAFQATFGTAINACTIAMNAVGGFYTEPAALPEDYDHTRPARLFVTIAKPFAPPIAGGNLILETVLTTCRPVQQPVNVTLLHTVVIPNNWPVTELRTLELLDGVDPAIPAQRFSRDSILGYRFRRNGSAVGDTWTDTIVVPTFIWIAYKELCQFGGCF